MHDRTKMYLGFDGVSVGNYQGMRGGFTAELIFKLSPEK